MKALLALLALAAPLAAGGPGGALQVTGAEGGLRLFRFETEPWPLEPGLPLPDNSRVELDVGARLRLRHRHYLEFTLAGPARLTVYVLPAPATGELEQDRVVLKLDEGALLVDGRFQFGRPADFVLSLPDQSLPLPKDERFAAVAAKGSSAFYRLQLEPQRQAFRVRAGSEAGAARLLTPAAKPEKEAPFPSWFFDELEQPVGLFILGRDFNQDLGLWPRPAILGPLLTERLGRMRGLRVVEGSGSTFHAYRANNALKTGMDAYLKQLGRERGARWVLVGNAVAESVRGPGERRVQGLVELRLLEAESDGDGLELVSESGSTRVARSGRALELAAREALELASVEAAGHLEWQLGNLLQGRPHAQVLLRLVLEGAEEGSLQALRTRLGAMDAVQRVFRRSYAQKVAAFDLTLRRTPEDFDAQWAAQPPAGWDFRPLPGLAGERRYRAQRREAGP